MGRAQGQRREGPAYRTLTTSSTPRRHSTFFLRRRRRRRRPRPPPPPLLGLGGHRFPISVCGSRRSRRALVPPEAIGPPGRGAPSTIHPATSTSGTLPSRVPPFHPAALHDLQWGRFDFLGSKVDSPWVRHYSYRSVCVVINDNLTAGLQLGFDVSPTSPRRTWVLSRPPLLSPKLFIVG